MTTLRSRPVSLIAFLLLSTCCTMSPGKATANDRDAEGGAAGSLLFEFVGQVSNFTPTTSTQYGYFTFVRGIDAPSVGDPVSEGTARFTFFREMTNVLVVSNGSIKMISREGTTTIYLNPSGGATFSNPDSFRAGTAIQTSLSRQQVIVDTTASTFTVTNFETVTATPHFSVDGHVGKLGRVGDVYRTSKQGHLNSPSPAGYFSGYSVSVANKDSW
ncbi:MAG: hypothetical protein WCC53_12005 [Thermoanaerobaculia bacterium]